MEINLHQQIDKWLCWPNPSVCLAMITQQSKISFQVTLINGLFIYSMYL